MTSPHPLKKRSFRSFAVFFFMAFLLVQIWLWASTPKEGDFISPVFRGFLETNGKIWGSLFSVDRLAPEFPARPKGTPARINGALGLMTDIDLTNWKMDVIANADDLRSARIQVSLQDLQALPWTESTIEFKCIEGWSQVISYKGVKFSDFLRHYQLGSHQPQAWKDGEIPSERFLYVGLKTPDGEYYVSNDMESMLHPQTILAYEMNGEALSLEHGAPLRLIIPVKYGIKSLKRIGQIYFSDQRPPDYWAERGYDWFSGL
ncbi:MAG: molybdopterin-dependent oxidoreductase [Pseudobdellovibrionaceae bacterium]